MIHLSACSAFSTRSRKISSGAPCQLGPQWSASSSMKRRSNRLARFSASVDLPELVTPTTTMRLYGHEDIRRSATETLSHGENQLKTLSLRVSVAKLSYINWIAEHPAAFETQKTLPHFDAIDTGFGCAIGAGIGISPDSDRSAILDQTDLSLFGQMGLQRHAAFDRNFLTHDDRFLQSFC